MGVFIHVGCGIFMFLCHNKEQNETACHMLSLKREIRHSDGDFAFHNFMAGKCNDKSCGLTEVQY